MLPSKHREPENREMGSIKCRSDKAGECEQARALWKPRFLGMEA